VQKAGGYATLPFVPGMLISRTWQVLIPVDESGDFLHSDFWHHSSTSDRRSRLAIPKQ
jgi:hypothetical protein